MKSKTVYLLFTDTGSYLSRLIHLYTREPLNHVSIALDRELTEVYSFGRKQPNNPFIGGFVKEDIFSPFLNQSRCEIYELEVTGKEYESIKTFIKNIEIDKDKYRYNFIGLFGIMMKIKITRQTAFFCSQFVATILQNVTSLSLTKDPYFTTPEDIRSAPNLKLVYEGVLLSYKDTMNIDPLSPTEQPSLSYISNF
ncbi:hypothetical protein [Oceanobacillus jeddahense]|uniref:hypothetical protein n=1 Tax=Oceanobacillus jeddahense TaxID=1462527 RepID=UPI000595EBE6|nr:hypothetical protein [Oceanobacillus jeddahense]